MIIPARMLITVDFLFDKWFKDVSMFDDLDAKSDVKMLIGILIHSDEHLLRRNYEFLRDYVNSKLADGSSTRNSLESKILLCYY